ncbi:MAG: ABC transporter permease [Bacteroidia bacterium]
MNKILLIIQREYLTRVKKKSFIIMTLLGPILTAGVFIVPVLLASQKQEKQKIEVIDDSFLFVDNIQGNDNINFDYPPVSIEQARQGFYNTNYAAILYIPKDVIDGHVPVSLFYKKEPGTGTEDYIKSSIDKTIFSLKLRKNNINQDEIENAKTSVDLLTIQQSESGKAVKTNTGLFMGIGYAAGMLIYFFIFLYGVQVMSGVVEEKTSRIIEVIISSVKPFQLMMGKIIGVALVGLTQFILWVVLSFGIYSYAQSTVLSKINQDYQTETQQQQQVFKKGSDLKTIAANKTHLPNQLNSILDGLDSINITDIVLCFLFYFLGGYLLYSALFAAVGAAIDSEADKQQFMMPITLPLIFSIVMASTVVQNPNSSISFWLSMIPFTSPIIMMVRLPFGVPMWQVGLSMTCLVAGFIFTTWLAGRIYRIGILMYGKKITYGELWKWLFYKG